MSDMLQASDGIAQTYLLSEVLESSGFPHVRFKNSDVRRSLYQLGCPNDFVVIKDGVITTFERMVLRMPPIATLKPDGTIISGKTQIGTYPEDLEVLGVFSGASTYLKLSDEYLAAFDVIHRAHEERKKEEDHE